MRLYTTKFVTTNFLANRRSNAACPFPGKYPLRLLLKHNDKVVYHGKFHSGIWRMLFKRYYRTDVYVIYDKAGCVLWGTLMGLPSSPSANLLFRYFRNNILNGNNLRLVEPQKIGEYSLYCDPATVYPSNSSYLRLANATPHVRTI